MNIRIEVANDSHISYAPIIASEIEKAAEEKGTGLAIRSVAYLEKKIREGHAIIALDKTTFVGFCYFESWEGNKYVANSGLLVTEPYRRLGWGKKIKKSAFEQSRFLFPDAIFLGLTTSLAVMKINSELGYEPVTFSELTEDIEFWKGCETCAYFDVLFRTRRSNCLCTAMKLDPKEKSDQSISE